MKSNTKSKKSVGQMAKEAGNTRFLFWLAVAAVIHIAFIAATSVGYIKELITGEHADATTQPSTQPAQEPGAAAPETAPADRPEPPAASEDDIPEDRKDSPMAKELNETAKPEERPTGITDEGLNLDE